MTTIHAAAVSRLPARQVVAATVSVLVMALAGCESTGSILGTGADSTNTPLAQAPAAPPQTVRARVSLAPVIGAPDAISKQLSSQLSQALDKQRVAIVTGPSEPFDFMVRGYVVAAPERGQSKISYIWDVNDPAGKRVNRITGEELVASAGSRDAWGGVTPQVVQAIADRTANSLVAALPASQAQANVAAAQPPSAAGAPPSAVVGQPPAGGVRTAAAAPGTNTTTGSLSGGSLPVVVPRVIGAPGDGSQSLSAALQRELSRNGVQVAQANATGAHRIEGRVVVGKAAKVQDEQGARDVQPIQIDWQVKNAKGENLGTVSQKNEIKPGELDGPWGRTADAAAAAAAQGILKLLQQPTSTN